MVGVFFNLHFLNYSKSCQVHIHNRKVTNRAVILKTRSADAIKLILKLFSGGKEEVDWIICCQPCGLKVGGMMPFQGENQIRLYTRDLAVQACALESCAFWGIGSRELLSCSSKNPEARSKVNGHSACKLLLTSS